MSVPILFHLMQPCRKYHAGSQNVNFGYGLRWKLTFITILFMPWNQVLNTAVAGWQHIKSERSIDDALHGFNSSRGWLSFAKVSCRDGKLTPGLEVNTWLTAADGHSRGSLDAFPSLFLAPSPSLSVSLSLPLSPSHFISVFGIDCLLFLELCIPRLGLEGSQVGLSKEEDTCSRAVCLGASEIHTGHNHVTPSDLISQSWIQAGDRV